MANALLQPSLARGELSPGLQSRVDLATYGSGVALGLNFIVLPDGGLQTRPGYAYLGQAKHLGSRLLRFVVSEDAAYAVELGDYYARFWRNGAPVESGGVPVEVVTPWPLADVWAVRYTQSVDVMFLAHTGYAPKRLRRLSETSFELDDYNFVEGPFRLINSSEILLMSASARTGEVEITSNFDAFTAGMIGTLVKLEMKALGQIKPWVPGEKGINVGDYRRSDGKVYQASAIMTASGAWSQTGTIRPTHDTGREWDGYGQRAIDSSSDYDAGVEWEYVHSGYGVAKITGFTDERTVTAVVQVPFPEEVVGGIGAPVNSWDFVGDGSTTTFSVTGATHTSQLNYQVTQDGEPV